jgi:hypothetical protein
LFNHNFYKERILRGRYWLQRAQEETEIAAIEEEIQRYNLELQSHKQSLEHKLGSAYSAVPMPSAEHRAMQQQQEQLANELRKVGCNSYIRNSLCKQNTILHFCPEPPLYMVFSEQFIVILPNQEISIYRILCFITLITEPYYFSPLYSFSMFRYIMSFIFWEITLFSLLV